MPTAVSPTPRERIVRAALALLEGGGVEAVTTRAVCAAAAVQPPTLYRQFGDMRGLLHEVASVGFSTYLRAKGAHARGDDPVEDLREGWDRHVEFGLTHPHLYTLMYGTPRPGDRSPAALESAGLLRDKVQRVAEAGRLAVGVERAAALFGAAAVGVTLSLLSAPTRDPGISEQLREAALGAILVPEAGATSDDVRQRAAPHAVALVALLPGLPAPFSAAEQALLVEWLRRLM